MRKENKNIIIMVNQDLKNKIKERAKNKYRNSEITSGTMATYIKDLIFKDLK